MKDQGISIQGLRSIGLGLWDVGFAFKLKVG